MSQSALPTPSPLFTGRWDAVVAELSRTIDLEATARQHKVIKRVKKLRSAEDLLRLAMIWDPGWQSYRETAALAAHGKIVDMSDKGIVGRMREGAGPSLTAAPRPAVGCSGQDEQAALPPNQKTAMAVGGWRTTHALQKADIFTRLRQ
jgi:hypothetical protein